ncbi:MAG: glucosamine-6-phosphate deaminase [Saprospiraceae bacterium]|nr:glucosamine-6-phosphate deaminase [Saprospiraceae bacterium]
MKIKIFEDTYSLAVQAATDLLSVIAKKPNALICFASGDSPKLTCELFVQRVLEEKIDISRCSFIELDEWVGVSTEIKGSCHYDFMHRLAHPLHLSKDQYHLFNGLSRDLHEECDLMDDFIQARGGRIDIMIVGLGMNGHIGFNEPEVDIDLKSHVILLDKTTIEVSKKYFDQPVTLTKGITLGLSYLIEAIRVILIATGGKKAEVIKNSVEGPITTSFPASIMQIHPEGYVFIDKEAGALLKPAIL